MALWVDKHSNITTHIKGDWRIVTLQTHVFSSPFSSNWHLYLKAGQSDGKSMRDGWSLDSSMTFIHSFPQNRLDQFMSVTAHNMPSSCARSSTLTLPIWRWVFHHRWHSPRTTPLWETEGIHDDIFRKKRPAHGKASQKAETVPTAREDQKDPVSQTSPCQFKTSF